MALWLLQLRASAASSASALENERLRRAVLEERLVALETGLPDSPMGGEGTLLNATLLSHHDQLHMCF